MGNQAYSTRVFGSSIHTDQQHLGLNTDRMKVLIVIFAISAYASACHIPSDMIGDWDLEDGVTKGFSLHDGHIVIWEDLGQSSETVQCVQRLGDLYMFKASASPLPGMSAYVCFAMQLLNGDLSIKIQTAVNSDAGVWVDAGTPSISTVCAGEVSEVHFLKKA